MHTREHRTPLHDWLMSCSLLARKCQKALSAWQFSGTSQLLHINNQTSSEGIAASPFQACDVRDITSFTARRALTLTAHTHCCDRLDLQPVQHSNIPIYVSFLVCVITALHTIKICLTLHYLNTRFSSDQMLLTETRNVICLLVPPGIFDIYYFL